MLLRRRAANTIPAKASPPKRKVEGSGVPEPVTFTVISSLTTNEAEGAGLRLTGDSPFRTRVMKPEPGTIRIFEFPSGALARAVRVKVIIEVWLPGPSV